MKRADLGGPVLQAVSRSFYLTIRLLPAELRDPIGLTYLLARTSDTIADSARASAAVRLEHLAGFERMVLGEDPGGLERMQREIVPDSPGERILMQQVGPCLEWLAALPEQDREETRSVLRKIIRGQALDLRRFGAVGEGRVVALQTGAELEEYAYLVAGCVGEYWTRVCGQHLPGYTRVPLDELCRLGVRYGQGLQLVNILRDLPEDLRNGRCYLPAEEVSAPDRLLAEPELGRAAFAHWLGRAREFLAEGAKYVRAIRPARLRMGVFLPWYLGNETLRLLTERPPLESAARLKVSRGTVYGGLARALVAGFSDAPLQ